METLRKAAGVPMDVHIFLASGNRVKRVKWHKGGTFADLLAAHKKGASPEFPKILFGRSLRTSAPRPSPPCHALLNIQR